MENTFSGIDSSKRNIILWSGGKDSTCSTILLHEMGMENLEVVFCEPMFCLKRNISGEHPMMMDFIYRAKEVFESWGYTVRILRHPTKDYLSMFHHIIEDPIKYPENKGRSYGFPMNNLCMIRRELKIRVAESYRRTFPKNSVVEFLGICADEPKRFGSLNENRRSILVELGYTQEMARDKCIQYGLYSPGYSLSNRGGCFFCPWASETELSYIKHEYPDVWEELLELEKFAKEENYVSYKFNVFRPSLAEYDKIL